MNIIFYCVFFSCICFQLSVIHGATTTKVPPLKWKNNSTRPTGNLPVFGKKITLRIGADGSTPEEECQCKLFYLCEKDDTIDVSENAQSCEENYVCCKLEGASTPEPPILSSSSTAPPEPGSSTSDSSVSSPPSTGNTCRCVPTDQCQKSRIEKENGVNGLDPRKTFCGITEWCCLPENIIGGVIPPSSGPNTGNPTPEPAECGMRNIGSSIFSNTRISSPLEKKNTSFGEFPWMALLLTSETDPETNQRLDNIFVCGASLLSSSILLTAAHCVQDIQNIKLLKVRLGEYDTHAEANKEQQPHQDRQVVKVTQHPSFRAKSLFNDIALLEVSEPFTFDYHIKPICISTSSNTYAYDPENCVATGWGKMAFGPDSKHHTTLKKVDLNIVPNDRCQEELRKTRLGNWFILDPSFICAGGEPGQDTCEGDGGGPLVCPMKDDPNRYVQVGIVSWGIGCGNSLPAVYASLEKNIEWLTDQYNSALVFSSNIDSRRSKQ